MAALGQIRSAPSPCTNAEKKDGGTNTAASSSPINDGAAALLIRTESHAKVNGSLLTGFGHHSGPHPAHVCVSFASRFQSEQFAFRNLSQGCLSFGGQDRNRWFKFCVRRGSGGEPTLSALHDSCSFPRKDLAAASPAY
ncbi:MAG: hypothetical protein EON56_00370 [Alphaproteobacteria bacterium]|nr:MAG: hypothetical protein EON56_00370 [Alphaproteobacteria bacterium]